MPEMTRRGRLVCTSGPYRLIARSVVLPWALQGQPLSGHVLEIGSGSGAIAAAIVCRFSGVQHLVATDYDPRMVASTARALRRFGDRAASERADAAALPFGDNRFNAVCSFAMLHHVVRWENALREAVRVLRPGGLLVGYDILGNRATQRLHVGAHHDTRMIRPGELSALLSELPVSDVRVREMPGTIAVRFMAMKSTIALTERT